MTPPGLRQADRPVLVMLAAGMAKRYGGCKPLAPLGWHGEAVIDLTTSDALEAGFGDVVLVLGPQSGPAIRYHVRRCWPRAVAVADVEQPRPLGTAHALLCARRAVGNRSFGVVNADDVYGVGPLATLADHLVSGTRTEHALVAFALADTVLSADAVTRGTVTAGQDGLLGSIAERRHVTRRDDGRFEVGDGLEPRMLPGTTPVSMNLWGFRPRILESLRDAVTIFAERTAGVPLDADGKPPECLLPDVIGALVNSSEDAVEVVHTAGRCLGLTHPDDLELLGPELERRPA